MELSNHSGFLAVMAFIGVSVVSGFIGAWIRGGGKKAHTCELHEQTFAYIQAIDNRQKEADKKRESSAKEFKEQLDIMCHDLGQLKTDVQVFIARQEVRNESVQVFGKAIEAFSAVLQQQKKQIET